jgi:hypothetical protein
MRIKENFLRNVEGFPKLCTRKRLLAKEEIVLPAKNGHSQGPQNGRLRHGAGDLA